VFSGEKTYYICHSQSGLTGQVQNFFKYWLFWSERKERKITCYFEIWIFWQQKWNYEV